MKFLGFLILVMSICIQGNSQELKKITRTLIPELKESYYVLKKNSKVRQGKYSMVISGDTVLSGFYNNNKKSGIWKYYYYNNKSLEFIYDFESNSIISDTIGKERPALYSEGHEYFEYLRAVSTTYPSEAIDAGHFGRVAISFIVKTDGSVSDFSLYTGCGDLALNNEAMRVIKKVAMQNSWYPAINAKGEKVNSTITKLVIFMLQ